MRRRLALIVLAFAGLCGGGCNRHIEHELTRPDGTRERFVYDNTGFDTKIGKLTMTKDGDKLGVDVENLDSQAKAMQLASEALKVLSEVARGAVKP